MALLSSTTGSLTGAMTGPILNWDPVPGLKYDKKRTDEGINLNQFTTLRWQLDATCTKKNGGGLLKDGTMKKKRMFVSYPRSGSTWMRMMIMNLFGIVSDRLDKNLKIPKDCGCTLTTRTHDYSVMRQKNYTKSEEVDEFDGNAILLIRNPFRAIISHRAILEYLRHRPASLNETYIEDEGWGLFVETGITHWERLATDWIRGLKRGGIFYHERMTTDFESEMKRLAIVMGIPLDQKRFECAVSEKKTSIHAIPPEMNYVYPTDPYTQCQKLRISQAIDRVQLVLKERNLDPLPVELYEFYEPSEKFCDLDCPVKYIVPVLKNYS
jgi:hypothetical protein